MAIDAAFGLTPEQVKMQQRYALGLLQNGGSTAPVASPMEGLARALTGALGGYFVGNAMDAEKEGQGRSAKMMADYLSSLDGTPAAIGGTVTAPKPDAAMPPVTPAPAPKVSAPQPMAQVPEIYRPHIEDAAAAYNVNPTTLANMLMAESGGRVNATSPAGAQGIMQFMPATAKQYGVDVTDPKSSIDGAAHYLSDLMKQFGGDERKAVAAYNAGPGRVQAAGGDLSRLPAETRAYVPRVLGAAPEPAPVQMAQANTGTVTDAMSAPGAKQLAAGLSPPPAQANGQAALIARMLQDPWTRDMGMQLALSGIKSKQDMQAQLQKLIAENTLKLQTEPALAKAKAEAENPALIARAGGEAEARQRAELQYAPQIAGAREQAVQAAQAPGKTFDREGKLRDDFNGLQPVKNWREVVPIYQSMVDAAGRDDKAAELNLIYGLAKIMDPASVVREGETQMVVKTGSPAEQLLGWFNYVAGGGSLTEDMRKNIMTEATSRVAAHQDAYGQMVRKFEGDATAYGLDPRRVITGMDMAPEMQSRIDASRNRMPPPPQPGGQSPQPPQSAQGQPKRITRDAAGQQMYNALPSGAEYIDPDGQPRRKK